ncbi:type IV toxin-antitoxin system AbiEi family antitoxin domain-containing protein [Xanthomarina spongicola]|uniref:Putative transcriptional regulator of viral defense system n=1 Tax=Xanthomarina spongicola TaxID=570520 RepID=A0A316DS68_9FLAO|nr:type IV toxin-antitoxin system AbiEi family antitoxin [Xanthomarina spongicola]PWK20019.1 putative transcriptional regulator of viral defense system [Xanthomarina spongicola]
MKEGALSYNYLEEFLDKIRAKGRFAFTLDEVKSQFNISDKAISQNLYRLKSKNKIVQIRKEFYTILPPEYAHQGIIPTNLFLDDMMLALNKEYYLGLISAAAIHGASHQQSMETFVITEKPALRNVKNKKLKINFYVKNCWNKEDILQVKTDAGYMNVSSPELTALDLLYYIGSLGMNRVITILEELFEVVKASELKKVAKNYPQKAAIQRLGYLSETILNNQKFSDILYESINLKKGANIPLMPGRNRKGKINTKWKIIHNVKIESDL